MIRKLNLTNITVTPYGKILKLMFENESHEKITYKSINEVKRAIIDNKLNLGNIKITPENTIITTGEKFKQISIYVNELLVRRCSFKITKAIYEIREVGWFNNIRPILELHIETSDLRTYNVFLTHGFKEEGKEIKKDTHGNKVITYKMSIKGIWLQHLLSKSELYQRMFQDLGIRLHNGTTACILDDGDLNILNREGTELIEDNTIHIKLNTWIEKMKIIGLYESYEDCIDTKSLSLIDYKGTEHKISIPPVRVISTTDIKCIKPIKIPETVNIISTSSFKLLKDIQLGENTFRLDRYMLGENIDTFDTYNSFSNLIIHNMNKLTYRLQFGSNLKLSDNYNIDEVEIIENQIIKATEGER